LETKTITARQEKILTCYRRNLICFI